MSILVYQKHQGENGVAVVKNLVLQMGLPVTMQAVERQVGEHPDYPSLYALNESLQAWSLHTMAVKLKPEHLAEIDYPAIAHLAIGQGHFVLLTGYKDGKVSYIDPKAGPQTKETASFLQTWQGHAILVEAKADSGEKGYAAKHRDERLGQLRKPVLLLLMGVVILAGLLVGLARHTTDGTNWFEIGFLKVVGAFVGVLLMQTQLAKQGSLLSQFCSIAPNGNCRDVLESKAAKLFGWLTLSELVCLFYFGGVVTMLLGLFTQHLDDLVGYLAILATLAVPFTLFSLYYQAFKLKQWCLLCLAVVGLVWMEVLLSIPTLLNTLPSLEVKSLSAFAIGMLLPLIAWITFRPHLYRSMQAEAYRRRLAAFQRNPQALGAMLMKEDEIDPGQMAGELYAGASTAPAQAILVVSPTCVICAEMYAALRQFIDDKAQKVCVVIRFQIDKENKPESYPVARTVLGIAMSGQNDKAIAALDHWFNIEHHPTLEKWQAAHPIPETVNEQQLEGLLEQHIQWCTAVNIQRTPMLYIHNRPAQLPGFELEEIKTYLSALIAQSEE